MKKNLKRFVALALSATLALAPVVSYAGEEITEEVVWEETAGDGESEQQNYGEEAGIEENDQLYSDEQGYSDDVSTEETVFEENEEDSASDETYYAFTEEITESLNEEGAFVTEEEYYADESVSEDDIIEDVATEDAALLEVGLDELIEESGVVDEQAVSEEVAYKTTTVCYIGETPYDSLAEAVSKADTGATITLVADDNVSLTDGSTLEINKSLTIMGATNSDGTPKFTIYGKSTATGTNYILITGSGTVTLSNLNIQGFRNDSGTDSGHAPVYVNLDDAGTINLNNIYVSKFNRGGLFLYGGTFNVEKCYIDCANSRDRAFTKGIEIKGSATGTISGTTVVNMERSGSDAVAGFEIYGNGGIEINNCNVYSDVGNHDSVNDTYGIVINRVGAFDPSNGTLKIDGGNYVTTQGTLFIADHDEYGDVNNYSITVSNVKFSNYVAVVSNSSITLKSGEFKEDVYVEKGLVTINGGTFTNFLPETYDSGVINITGGKFQKTAPFSDAENGISISGGIYSQLPPEHYLAEDKYAVPNKDAKTKAAYPYAISSHAVASIMDKDANTVFYETIADAVSAVKSNEVIELLANCPGFVLTKSPVKIDKSDYTLNDSTVITNDSTKVVRYSTSEDITTYVLESAAARIGDTGYLTLSQAVSSAKSGDTITVLKNLIEAAPITVDKDITLAGGSYAVTPAITVTGAILSITGGKFSKMPTKGEDGKLSSKRQIGGV